MTFSGIGGFSQGLIQGANLANQKKARDQRDKLFAAQMKELQMKLDAMEKQEVAKVTGQAWLAYKQSGNFNVFAPVVNNSKSKFMKNLLHNYVSQKTGKDAGQGDVIFTYNSDNKPILKAGDAEIPFNPDEFAALLGASPVIANYEKQQAEQNQRMIQNAVMATQFIQQAKTELLTGNRETAEFFISEAITASPQLLGKIGVSPMTNGEFYDINAKKTINLDGLVDKIISPEAIKTMQEQMSKQRELKTKEKEAKIKLNTATAKLQEKRAIAVENQSSTSVEKLKFEDEQQKIQTLNNAVNNALKIISQINKEDKENAVFNGWTRISSAITDFINWLGGNVGYFKDAETYNRYKTSVENLKIAITSLLEKNAKLKQQYENVTKQIDKLTSPSPDERKAAFRAVTDLIGRLNNDASQYTMEYKFKNLKIENVLTRKMPKGHEDLFR